MSNYYPVIMWLSEKRGGMFIYVPSWAHFRVNQGGPFRTWGDAMRHMLRHMQVGSVPIEVDRGIIPGFWPIVLHQDERPDLSGEQTFRMIVRKIPLHDQGDDSYSIG